MKDLYLYHATSKDNLASILEKGLLINPPKHNWNHMDVEDKIFFAFNPIVAENYAIGGGISSGDVVFLRVKISDLADEGFAYDWNNRCEYTSDINSVVYCANVRPEYIEVINNINEVPTQELYDFRNTYMYVIVKDVFDYEVETNKESE